MEDYLKRVIDEQKELEIKLKKLEDFTLSEKFKELDPFEQKLLEKQYSDMYLYNWDLRARLEFHGHKIGEGI